MGNSTVRASRTRAEDNQINWVEEAEQGDAPAALSWRVRTNGRVRNLKIQIYPHGGVEIVAPPRTRPAVIEAFVAEHTAWIIKTRRQFAAVRPPEPTLPERIELLALDEQVRLHFEPADKATVREKHGVLTVRAPQLEGSTCWPLLQDWLRKRARKVMPDLCMDLGRRIGLKPERVQIRLQKTRWGSCSTNGTISLNAAALLRPPEELHYVMIHELCHLRHMNHSRRFWNLVGEYVPDYKAVDKSLDKAWQTSPNWLIG